MAKRFLTRQEILDVDDLKMEEVPVPEWGGHGAVVMVRSLTRTERDRWEESVVERREQADGTEKIKMVMQHMRTKLLAMCIVGEDGAPLFSQADVAALGNKSAAPIVRIDTVARRLSGLSKEDVEKLTKNSEDDPNGGSTSGSLVN